MTVSWAYSCRKFVVGAGAIKSFNVIDFLP